MEGTLLLGPAFHHEGTPFEPTDQTTHSRGAPFVAFKAPLPASQAKLDFALRWVEVHAQLAGQLKKPVVLSEFGKQAGEPGARAAYFGKVPACL